MRKKDGYSIIEVTLVMMIAGLIFLMVFTALPTMWANERDSERRTDVAYFIDRLKSFQTNNNRGALPSGSGVTITTINSCGQGNTWQDFYNCYFNESFMDPSGDLYQLRIAERNASGTAQPCGYQASPFKSFEDYLLDLSKQDYTMHVIIGATCDGSNAVESANKRNVAVMYRLERGAVYCENT